MSEYAIHHVGSEPFTVRGCGHLFDAYRWEADFPDRPLGEQRCLAYHETWNPRRHASLAAAEKCAADIIAGRKQLRVPSAGTRDG